MDGKKMSYKNYEIYKDEKDFQLKVKVRLDLTGASVIELHVLLPDGDEVIWTCTAFSTDPTYLIYNVEEGDLSQLGEYSYQAYVEKNGLKKYGRTRTFEVLERYK